MTRPSNRKKHKPKDPHFDNTVFASGPHDRRSVRYDRQFLSVDQLTPHPLNPTTHSQKQLRQLAASYGEFGFTNPILADENGVILAGAGRWKAAKLALLSTVPAGWSPVSRLRTHRTNWAKCRIATIEFDDAVILAHDANPDGPNFREGQRTKPPRRRAQSVFLD